MANAEIPERKIRQIWDAIDSRQFKNGLKFTNALLAKYPNSAYVIALKALVLERLEKREEALSVCFEAKECMLSDDVVQINALSTLQIVFQRLDRLDLATVCYEHASKQSPTNLELMMGLFNCHVREYSFVKQQQVALKMYKHSAEERFLHWTVCSILLQDVESSLLIYAESLIGKHIVNSKSKSLSEPEGVLLYISVLERQAKYSDALKILSGPLGALIVLEIDRLRIKGRLLARSCDYATAANVFGNVLQACPDDWECFLQYLSCLLEDDSMWCGGTTHDQIHPPKIVDSKLSHLSDEVFDSRMSKASLFARNLKPPVDRLEIIRCPHLAHFEIERRKILQGKGDIHKLMKALVKYFCRFGHLACFTSDVEMFLQVLTTDERIELVKNFMKSSGAMSNSPLRVLCEKITIYKIQELLGFMFELPLGELENTAVTMTQLYTENLPLSKDLDLQENMHGEELLSMACNVLVQLFWRTQHLGYLLEAILILEFGLTVRRYISQYKILLVHLYSHLGALPLAHERYKTLDIKNILLETVSHHILPQMLTSPFWANSTNLLEEYLSFMEDHLGESADLTFLAYRHRNYSKVIEFVKFRDRLQYSHKYLMARLESPILQLKQNANNIEELENVLQSSNHGNQSLELPTEKICNSLTFNEDMQTRPWWTPTPDINYLLEPYMERSIRPGLEAENSLEQSKKKGEENVQRVIKRRSFVPRLIYVSIQSALFLKKNIEASSSQSNSNNSEFLSLLERYAGSLGFPFTNAVDVIVGMSRGQKSFQDFSSDMVDWINFAVFLNAWKLGSPDEDGSKSGFWHVVDSLIEKFTEEKMSSLQPLINSPGVHLTVMLQMVTEPLAWHCVIINSCIRLLLPSVKKKKKSGPAEKLRSPLSEAILSSIQSLCGTLEVVAKWLRENISRSEDVGLDTMVSLLQGTDSGEEGNPFGVPGKVFKILRNLPSSTTEVDYGERISEALNSWDAVEVGRKIIASQNRTMTEFLKICESKSKLLKGLKQRLQA